MDPAGSSAASTNTLFITEIHVDQLFGQYTYDLKPEANSNQLSRLLILYGENGSGKTTLLWLVFHLLSRELRKGHRTFLAKSRFRRLAVHLANGGQLIAERTGETLTGSFEMSYVCGSQTYRYFYKADDKDSILGDLTADKEHIEFTEALPDLSIKFLSDDRKISTDLDLEADNDRTITMYWDESLVRAAMLRDMHYMALRESERPRPQRWESALDRVAQWVRDQAIQASNRGQLDFNAIYSDIVRRVSRPSSAKVHKKPEDLVTMLKMQAERNHEYAKFGLTSDLRVEDILHSISRVDKRRLIVINQILRPYIEGNEARLRALASLQRSIQTFVDGINDFLVNKWVTFDVREGLKIFIGNHEPLAPSALSSGEKQLLILLCNILSSSGKPTIFIIDEPEISLNASWQRKLLDAMVRCVGENQVQFFFATHSLELMARHMDKVAKLANKLPLALTTPPTTALAPANSTEA